MKLKVMSLNDGGLSKFQTWLENPIGEPPRDLLDDDQYCDSIAGEYFVDTDLQFSTTDRKSVV